MRGSARHAFVWAVLSMSLMVSAAACGSPFEAYYRLQDIEADRLREAASSAPDQATEEPTSDVGPAPPLHTFTVDDCACVGVDIPLLGDSSSARNNTYSSQTWPSGTEYETDGGLACEWQTTHTSDDLTGTIRVHLQVTRIADQHQAQALFGDLGQRVAEQQPWCEQDLEACTVAAAEYTDEWAYLVRQYIYVGGDGVVKPSSHHGNLARLIQGPSGFLVYELGVTHPELELGDTWVVDVTTAVETCVAPLAE